MNLLDIIILVVMIFLIVRGIFRGFFMEIASLAGVILGILLGLHYYPQATEILKPHLPSFDFSSLSNTPDKVIKVLFSHFNSSLTSLVKTFICVGVRSSCLLFA